MIKLASESIERFPSSRRDITSVTLNVSEENYNIIIDKLRALRKELLEMAEADVNPKRVAQLNLQLFPLSCDLENGREFLC
jgi:uncharacterized protein (TIGR02147 family)